MAQVVTTIKITLRLPWWWRPYVAALKFFSDAGVLDIDSNVAASFIVRHTRFECKGMPLVDVKTSRYFERAPFGFRGHPSEIDLDSE